MFTHIAILTNNFSSECSKCYADSVIEHLISGLSSGLVPMYLTEISPVNLRGSLGSVAQLLVTIGILFSQVIGLPQLLGSETLWPMIFGNLNLQQLDVCSLFCSKKSFLIIF